MFQVNSLRQFQEAVPSAAEYKIKIILLLLEKSILSQRVIYIFRNFFFNTASKTTAFASETNNEFEVPIELFCH